MCGISGLVSALSIEAASEKVSDSLRRIKHRGPDSSALADVFLDTGSVVLGHNRLSIIDLSEGGKQPKVSADSRYLLVFNGEIYNYKELRAQLEGVGQVFTTQSDTEVLLGALIQWGVDCIPKLTGMFAFVFYDTHSKEVLCARDAFGIKPFFYELNNTRFAFSSEMGGLFPLLEGTPVLNDLAIYNYLVNADYDGSEQSFYEGIKHLSPGSCLKLKIMNAGFIEPKLERWWWPNIAVDTTITFDSAVEQLKALFMRSVSLHMQSDVPIGAALSGGLDSSAVVSVMRYLYPDLELHTFTYVAQGSIHNEEEWADRISKHTNATAHKVYAGAEGLKLNLHDLVATQGEPFGSTSIYAQYCVFQSARENGIIVTLDGQGADEVLAGYTGYSEQVFRSYVENGRFLEGIKFLINWSKWPGRSKSEALMSFVKGLLPINTLLRMNLKNLLKSKPDWIQTSPDFTEKIKEFYFLTQQKLNTGVQGRRLSSELRNTLTIKGLPSLLRHADRNAMRWSIESRVPFLTTEIAEFMLRLPEHFLVSKEGETKHLFRSAMKGIIPEEVLNRKDKVGFVTPENQILKELKAEVFEWLVEIGQLDYVNYEAVILLFQEYYEGKRGYSSQLWRIINICRWLKYTKSSFS